MIRMAIARTNSIGDVVILPVYQTSMIIGSGVKGKYYVRPW